MNADDGESFDDIPAKRKVKKPKRKDVEDATKPRKKPRKQARRSDGSLQGDQLRRTLEEDMYSAVGSIVDTDSEDEIYLYRGQSIRLDKAAIASAAKKLEKTGGYVPDKVDKERRANNVGKKKKQRRKEAERLATETKDDASTAKEPKMEPILPFDTIEEDLERDGGSIFGQTTGSSNATWVECDKCKKWRRLRGVVDEKKLPTKWYCSMNKNDPDRSRCSAPEEEYEAPHTPESAADARVRKHLRVWVRRLQCNEAYESRLPALTRGKKRAAASSSKEPYEWVRCCNPSCGKWRAILRIMDAKANVIDRTKDGEWYCVMNTWDEKAASCAAPQENLPAIGCPPWVMQDDE